MVKGQRKKAENRVAAGGEGDGDGENIINEKGGAGEHARPSAQCVRGYYVPAAAMGKMLYYAGIGISDDPHSKGGCETEEDGQV